MSTNRLQTLMGAFSREITAALAKTIGGTPPMVTSALGMLLPALLGAMTQKAATPPGANGLFARLTGSNVDAGFASSIGTLIGSGQTASLVQVGSSLLGGQAPQLSGKLDPRLTAALGLGAPAARRSGLPRQVGATGGGAADAAAVAATPGPEARVWRAGCPG